MSEENFAAQYIKELLNQPYSEKASAEVSQVGNEVRIKFSEPIHDMGLSVAEAKRLTTALAACVTAIEEGK